MATATATSTAASQSPTAPPFTLASAFTSREMPGVPATAISASSFQPTGFPLNIPAYGWLSNIVLEVTVTGTTGGVLNVNTGAAGLIDRIGFRTSAGQPLIVPISGYNLYLDNKYTGKTFGATTPFGRNADPYLQYGTNLSPAANGGTLHFFLALQFEVDHSSGLGCLPATSSDRQFTMDLTLAGYTSAFSTNPTTPADLTIAIAATAWYWDLPSAGQTPFGVTPTSQTFRLLQTETQPINEGTNTLLSSAKGNVIMNSIFKCLGAGGVRDETDMATTFEIDLDNAPRLWLPKSQWRSAMSGWFGFGAQGEALDAPGGQDSGVFVVPWRLLAGGQGAAPSSSHSQYFATLNTSTIVFKGYGYGAGVSSAEILTDSITSPDPRFIYSK